MILLAFSNREKVLTDKHQVDSLPDKTTQHQTISCQVCHGYIGYIDHQATGSRLYKWRLRSTPTSQLLSKSTSPGSSTLPSLATIIGAQLVASIQSQGVSRFVLLPARWMSTSQVSPQQSHDPSRSRNALLHATPTSALMSSSAPTNPGNMSSLVDHTAYWSLESDSWRSTSLNLWILTPSLRFSRNNTPTNAESGSIISLSETEPGCGTLAMKVFWKAVTMETGEALVEGSGVEEILLPAEAICGIQSCLRSTSSLLPPSARKFQNWNVGLLERYDE
jgi:hypothetical protein